MQYIGDILCLEYNEFVPHIMLESTYDSNKNRKNISVHGIGGNGRTVLIEYETLPSKYKEKVISLYGNPYQYALKQPILHTIKHDQDAQNFYTNYILPNGSKLPSSPFNLSGKPQINYVERYTTAANWANMLIELTADKSTLKKEFNISIMEFWKSIGELIKIKKVKLPSSRKHLLPKIKEYKELGYESLIEKHKFGNNFSTKVIGDTAQAVLFKMLSLRNKHADTVIAEEYSKWAIENNLQPITPEAVGYWRKKWHLRLSLERDGVAKTVTRYSKQIQRKRPSAPLLLINGDDNVMDIYFRTESSNWHRPVLYVVIDAFNDYILGYAYGNNVTVDLVKEAYRNANRHIMELTGDSYQWHQLQTDRWAISGKNTTPLERFYRSTGIFTPAQLKNSQSKYIERSFGTVWHQMLKKLFPVNYSGHNLTAKQRLNPDNLKPVNFPHIEKADKQIAAFIELMRRTIRKGCELNRQQEWVAAFNESDKSKKRLLSEEQRLQIFGKQNLKRNSQLLETNRITSKGIEVSILGQKRVYELSQQQIASHIGTEVNVIYDEADLSKVLITDGGQLRFIAGKYKKVPSAISDYEEGDAARILQLQSEKKQLSPMILKSIEEREAILQRKQIDAESRIQAGVLVKAVTHKDQQLITAQNNGAKRIEIPEEEEIDIYAQMRRR